jgi:ABC-type branched-subunit amino acid transport system ATPase component
LSADPTALGSSPGGASGALRASGSSLSVASLTAGYDRSPIVHDVSLDVRPGEIVSMVGPNGSGKSTLLKAIVGLVEVMDGRVLLDDTDVTRWAPEEMARAGAGYVPQVDDVFPPLTVRENLELGGYLLPKHEVTARVEHVLGVFPQLGRMLTRRAAKLSGGERKMLAMGRVLMLQPSLVALDEPTANLAPAIAREVLEQHVRHLADIGTSVLIVEQRARAVLQISDRTYVLGGGRVVTHGSPDVLASSPEFVESFLGGVARA